MGTVWVSLGITLKHVSQLQASPVLKTTILLLLCSLLSNSNTRHSLRGDLEMHFEIDLNWFDLLLRILERIDFVPYYHVQMICGSIRVTLICPQLWLVAKVNKLMLVGDFGVTKILKRRKSFAVEIFFCPLYLFFFWMIFLQQIAIYFKLSHQVVAGLLIDCFKKGEYFRFRFWSQNHFYSFSILFFNRI